MVRLASPRESTNGTLGCNGCTRRTRGLALFVLAVPGNLGWNEDAGGYVTIRQGGAHVDLVLLDEIDRTVIDRESGAAGYGGQ